MARESWGSPTDAKQLLQLPLKAVDTEERQLIVFVFFFSENFQWQPKILHGGGSGFRRWWSWGERSVSQQRASWRIVPRILCSILYQCWFKVSFPLNKWFLIFWSSNPGAMHIPGSLRWHLSSQGKETVKKENRVGGVAIQKKKKNHEGQALAQMKSKEQIKTQSRCCWFTACMYTCMGRVQVCLYRDW